jgi:hypothetical protein
MVAFIDRPLGATEQALWRCDRVYPLHFVLAAQVLGYVEPSRLMVALAGCTWGLTTTCSRSVGRSATSAVVTTWVGLFVVDFFLSLVCSTALE